MFNKLNRNIINPVHPKAAINSKTPTKSVTRNINSKKTSDSIILTSRSRVSRDLSSEPVRMAITLEEIIKTSKKSGVLSSLKPELIEPEIEASIPCIEYVPKIVQPAPTILRQLSPVENNTSNFKVNTSVGNDAVEFSFERMDNECKKIEENLVNEKHRATIKEIEKAIGGKFSCKVKMVLEKYPKTMPSAVIVKSGENIEMFSISNIPKRL